MYFTLGCFKEKEAFKKNMMSAKSFSKALIQTFSEGNKDINWKVVITGTDATLPSTHESITMKWGEHKLEVPTYKISDCNYVYAMSKLGQFYTIANAVSTIHNIEQPNNVTMTDIVKKITRHINAAGDIMEYHKGNDAANNIIHMADLNEISVLWTNIVQPSIDSHLVVANGLSILYTPLHLHWVQEAIDECRKHNNKYGGSIKAFITHQVVETMSNAVSISFGADSHVKHYEVGRRNQN